MDTSVTLADLPTDLHRLILSHDEEKIQIKEDNEKLRTQVQELQSLLDRARPILVQVLATYRTS